MLTGHCSINVENIGGRYHPCKIGNKPLYSGESLCDGRCAVCKHSELLDGVSPYCNYIINTGVRRPCAAGPFCTEFEYADKVPRTLEGMKWYKYYHGTGPKPKLKLKIPTPRDWADKIFGQARVVSIELQHVTGAVRKYEGECVEQIVADNLMKRSAFSALVRGSKASCNGWFIVTCETVPYHYSNNYKYSLNPAFDDLVPNYEEEVPETFSSIYHNKGEAKVKHRIYDEVVIKRGDEKPILVKGSMRQFCFDHPEYNFTPSAFGKLLRGDILTCRGFRVLYKHLKNTPRISKGDLQELLNQ